MGNAGLVSSTVENPEPNLNRRLASRFHVGQRLLVCLQALLDAIGEGFVVSHLASGFRASTLEFSPEAVNPETSTLNLQP